MCRACWCFLVIAGSFSWAPFASAQERVAAGAPSSAATAGSNGGWVSISPPRGSYGHAATYDPVRKRMVVSGGLTSLPGFDVWGLSLAGDPGWSELGPSGIPPYVVFLHSAIYDPVRDRMVVYGGGDPFGSLLGDVWQLSLTGSPRWTKLAPAGVAPAPRYGHTAIYDPVRDRMVVFGGFDGSPDRNDVWALSLAGSPTWTQITPAGTPPSPRERHTAIYDPVRDRMLVFGGNGNDVWALSFTGSPTWVQLAPAGSPPPGRGGHGAIYDPVRDRMVVFGGPGRNDVWALSLAGIPAWTQLSPTGEPPPPQDPSWLFLDTAIYDPILDRMVVFGGVGRAWALSLAGNPAWTALTSDLWSLPERSMHTAIHDPIRDRMIVFAGDVVGPWLGLASTAYASSDAWAFSLAGEPGWLGLGAGGPSERSGHSSVYDPVRDRMVTYGGEPSGEEVWALSLAGSPAWAELAPAGTAPAGRVWHTSVHDPVRDRMVVFGGTRSDGHASNDVWALSLGASPTWTELHPAGSPPPSRHGHTAIYDPMRDRMVVFGGADDSGRLRNDAWELTFSGGLRWTQLAPAGSLPPEREWHTAIYDPVRNRMVVFGGYDGIINWSYGGSFNDVWALSFAGSPAWTRLEPAGTMPPVRNGHSAIYDPLRDRMVVYGGRDGFPIRTDAKALAWGTPLLPPPALTATAGPASIKLHWNPSPSNNVVAYRISYGTVGEAERYTGDQAAEGPSGIEVRAKRTSFSLTCLPDSVFRIVVQAVGAEGGRSGWSHEALAQVLPVGGTLAMSPRSLNTRSKGQSVSGVFEPGAGFSAEKLVLESLRLNEVLKPQQTTLGDANRNGIKDVTLKFARDALLPLFPPGDYMEARVSGRLLGCRDTLTCSARDTIWFVKPRVLSPVAGTHVPAGSVVRVSWTIPAELAADSAVVLMSTDNQRTWAVVGRGPAQWSACDWRAPTASAESCYVEVMASQRGQVMGVGHGGPFGVTAALAATTATEPFRLYGARPQPYQPGGRIVFAVPVEGAVTLRVFDVRGRLVQTLVDGRMPAGRHEVAWDARGLATGVYFAELRSGALHEHQRLVLVR
jgi:galactose oxidase-like protein